MSPGSGGVSFVERMRQGLRDWAIGDGIEEIVQVVLAAAIIYLLALWVARSGKKRFFGRNTVFDLLLALILGSVLSRAINGTASLAGTALAGFVLVSMHYLFGTLAERSDRIGRMVKGRGDQIVKDGQMVEHDMHQHHLTRRDLEEAARHAGLRGIEEIESAYFERDGNISIVPRSRVRVVEIDVEDGVKRVRVEIVN